MKLLVMAAAAVCALAGLEPLAAQDIKLPPSIEKLADKASEVVDVTMDSSLLQLALKFLPDKDPDSAKVKKLVSGLKGIYVRSFEFENAGEYQQSDVEAIRVQLKSPAWNRIVTVRSRKKGENAEVYVKTDGGQQISGLMILSAEPKELTIVSISGFIRPEDLQELGGHFGIPGMEADTPRKDGSVKKDEE
jgi:hypothetical protein